MPVLKGEDIENITYHIFCAAGAPQEHARVVAQHLAEANLVGHDSHGLLRVLQYVSQIKSGAIVPDARPEIVHETPSTAQVDGHRCFGQVAAKFATEVAIEKARKANVSCVAMRQIGHLGRLGAYTNMAAKTGMAAIAFCGSGGAVHIQAPFGGREGRLSTNPIAMSFPSDLEAPIMADFATSVVAEGKLRVALDRGEEIPNDWIYDRNGNPSTNPADFYQGGTLRPFGGYVGHKGYCLAFMAEVFGGIVTRDGYAREGTRDFQPSSFISNGTLLMVMNVGAFAPLETARAEVGELARCMKNTPPASGFDQVLYPGEKEAKTAMQRQKAGVHVPEATWKQVLALINEYDLRETLAPLP